ncbi:MAG: hypothetical protein BMS9Abin05_0470 [Rhodothermia bacterium]|nr:MAG: hypothetical protein BMS9Abin05_0470 [Rhodothermia bacterium]
MFDNEPEGATPIDLDDAGDLLPKHIRTRAELNLWEQENILEATRWAQRARLPIVSERAIREMHRRMFDSTWAWAGRYRTSDKNIGVTWSIIPQEIILFVEDTRF